MATLFANIDKGIFLNINTDTKWIDLLEAELYQWLHDNHEKTFYELEMFSGGSVVVGLDCVTFWGDNGILTMESIEVETLELV
jgi:hypothetical protein